MTPSVHIDENTQDRLQRLREEIALETGQEVTQQALLKRIVEQSYSSRADLVDAYIDERGGLTEMALRSGTVDATDDETPSD